MGDATGNSGGKPSHKGTANLRPFVKGQPSANPSGRPAGTKGLAAQIRERTKDGRVILDILMEILTEEKKASPRDKLEAAKILLDRGYGKAIETQVTVNANAMSAEVAAEMADAHLESLARQLVASVAKPSESLRNLEEAQVVDVPCEAPLLTSGETVGNERSSIRLGSEAGNVPTGGSKTRADGGTGG